MRKIGIDYGDSRVGIAITDMLGITVQGLETINHNGNDKIVLKRLQELFEEYEIDEMVKPDSCCGCNGIMWRKINNKYANSS